MFGNIDNIPWIFNAHSWRAYKLRDLYGAEAAGLVRQEMFRYYAEDTARVDKLVATLATKKPPSGMLLTCAAFNQLAGSKRLDRYLNPSGSMVLSLEHTREVVPDDIDGDGGISYISDAQSFRDWQAADGAGDLPSTLLGYLIIEQQAEVKPGVRLAPEHVTHKQRWVNVCCPWHLDGKASARFRHDIGLFQCYGAECLTRDHDPDSTGLTLHDLMDLA